LAGGIVMTPPLVPELPHTRHMRPLSVCLYAWLISLLLSSMLWAQAAPRAETFPTQPEAVRALRDNFTQSAQVLRDRADAMRRASGTATMQAWATIALIEFENELEHEDIVFALLDELESTTRDLQIPDLRFAALTLAAVINTHRGRLQLAQIQLEQLHGLLPCAPNSDWETLVVHNEGVLQRKLGHFDAALQLFERAAELQRSSSAHTWLAHELNSIGMLHGRTGRFSDAALVHQEALKLARVAVDQPEIARSLRLLGVLYRNLDDEERATEYLREALTQIQERNRREAIILTAELGISLMNMERFDEAAGFVEDAVTMAEASGNAQNKVNAYSRMADLELLRGRLDEAKRWVDRAWLEHDHVAVRDQVLLGLSRVRVLSVEGTNPDILAEARATLAAARSIGDRILERNALDLVADLELKLGDAASAYATRKAHQKLDKELAMDMAGRRIAVLEASLEQERTTLERQILTRDNQIKDLRIIRQRYLGLALISGILALSAVLALLFWRVRSMRQSNNALRANRDQLAQLHRALLQSTERLEHMANTDSLTGVANRHAVMGRIGQVWQSQNLGTSACLMLIDLDHFKLINDRHSHQAGDAVLRTLAERMRSALPAGALIGRWGGEEFVIVAEAIDTAGALQLAEELRQALETTIQWEGISIPCSGSIGVALLPGTSYRNAGDWIAASDEALYRAKHDGRNRVRLAPSDSDLDPGLPTDTSAQPG
jgi:diguanylate cyclase (GGDEF)-like protein